MWLVRCNTSCPVHSFHHEHVVVPHRAGVDRMPEQPQTWHYGLMAQWWSEFNLGGPEIAYFQQFIEGPGSLLST
jgi:hypothetical protein